ncbi:MAG: BrnT family toxin [Rhodobacteraceae bacterium]|nr:BrnT family toxin [Paracoccaceae bacterium]MYG10685.1 BrnT family toxin [Paracoccaceae bacterium]
MRFRWDPSKSAKCRAERGFDFDYASRVFSDPSHCIVDSSRRGEARYKVYGMIEGRVYVVVYTPRPGSIYRIISARKAKPREVREYEDSGN